MPPGPKLDETDRHGPRRQDQLRGVQGDDGDGDELRGVPGRRAGVREGELCGERRSRCRRHPHR